MLRKPLNNTSTKWPLISSAIGAIGWSVWWFLNRPQLAAANWAEGMVLLGALVHVPLTLALIDKSSTHPRRTVVTTAIYGLQLPAGLCLIPSFQLPTGITAAALAVPWLVVTLLISTGGFIRIIRGEWNEARILCTNVGCLYILVGGIWCVISRSGARPWDFEALIVLMTAVHFHLAAFVLPTLAGCVLQRTLPAAAARMAAFVLLAAIPLLAVAITVTHFKYSPVIEWVVACLMTSAATLIAVLHVRLAFQSECPVLSRILWGIAGSSLIVGMLLAAAYGLRETGLVPKLEIPTMIATHGTINAFGFCLAGLLGWLWAEKRWASGERKLPGS